jgi:hypothetical protein
MLRRVASARGLDAHKPVVGSTIGRDEGIRRIMARAQREVPKEVLAAQGELLGGLGLIPVDYDFVEGILSLIRAKVAGFYDPDDKRMFLIDDLEPMVKLETLAHELVHALQDQHFELGKVVDYRPGAMDEVSAAQALAEGEAMSAMIDVVGGSAFRISPEQLRARMASPEAVADMPDVPPVLHAALVAPYTDGFRFVQLLRARGGWQAVDRVWKALPASTEQLLHIDKYDAGEAPLKLAALPVPAGDGWRALDRDSLGEQGLRIVLEQWTHRRAAAQAAAGWGGDHYLVVDRPHGEGREGGVLWHLRFDSELDAAEMAAVVGGNFGAGCRERPKLGALTWMHAGRDVTIAIGFYRRASDGSRRSAATGCPATIRWAAAATAR